MINSVETVNVKACSHCGHGQHKTVLSCPCRRCEQAVSLTECLYLSMPMSVSTARLCTGAFQPYS